METEKSKTQKGVATEDSNDEAIAKLKQALSAVGHDEDEQVKSNASEPANNAKTISKLKEIFGNNNKPLQKTVERRTWDEFRKTGLFMFVNTILHAFGWALVVEVDTETSPVKNCYPARVKFRGFCEDDQTEMHERIADYLANTSPNFPEEIK